MASVFTLIFFVLSLVLAESVPGWRLLLETQNLHHLSGTTLIAIVIFFSSFVTYKHRRVTSKGLKWNRNLYLWTGTLSLLIIAWLGIYKSFGS